MCRGGNSGELNANDDPNKTSMITRLEGSSGAFYLLGWPRRSDAYDSGAAAVAYWLGSTFKAEWMP